MSTYKLADIGAKALNLQIINESMKVIDEQIKDWKLPKTPSHVVSEAAWNEYEAEVRENRLQFLAYKGFVEEMEKQANRVQAEIRRMLPGYYTWFAVNFCGVYIWAGKEESNWPMAPDALYIEFTEEAPTRVLKYRVIN